MNTDQQNHAAAIQGMGDIQQALMRSMMMFRHRDIWKTVLWPPLLSYFIWIVVGIYFGSSIADWLMGFFPLSWLADSPSLAGWARFIVVILVWMLLLVLAYLTATLLVSLFLLPQIIKLAVRDYYPDLARMGSNNPIAGSGYSLLTALLSGLGALITAPLWIVPLIGGLIHMVFWTAWVNQRTFPFDVLVEFASRDEFRHLRKQHRKGWFVLGTIMAIQGFIPLLNLLVPALTAMAYTNYCLNALDRLRGGAVLTQFGGTQKETS